MRLCSGNPPVWHLPDLSNCISKWMYDIKKMVSTGSALMSWCLCSEKGRTPLLPSHPPPSPPKKNYCWSEFKLVRAANKFALCYPDGMIGSIKMEALHQVINYDLKLANVPLWFTWYINFPDNRKVISDTKSYWQSRIFRKLISYFLSISPFVFHTPHNPSLYICPFQLDNSNVSLASLANQLSNLTDVKNGKPLYAGDLKLLVNIIGVLTQRGPGTSKNGSTQDTSQTFLKVVCHVIQSILFYSIILINLKKSIACCYSSFSVPFSGCCGDCEQYSRWEKSSDLELHVEGEKTITYVSTYKYLICQTHFFLINTWTRKDENWGLKSYAISINLPLFSNLISYFPANGI